MLHEDNNANTNLGRKWNYQQLCEYPAYKPEYKKSYDQSFIRSKTSGSTDKNKRRIGQHRQGIDYPLDIWFIISEYIAPECVGKFARICKSSYYVVTTGKFWFHLYKSFYKPVPELPECLKPQCMVRQHGLRVAVIRTLHYTYYALQREKGVASCLQKEDPHSLVKRRCTLMWHREGKVRWHFFFKLKELTKNHKTSLREDEASDEADFFDTPEDVAANPEEGCKLLQVVTSKYTMLPLVIGMILQKVSISLMPGFKEQKLQLGFGTSDLPSSQTGQIVLNEVIDYHILNWWHRYYPHQEASSDIQLNTTDSWEKM